jgi:hypothetical protein
MHRFGDVVTVGIRSVQHNFSKGSSDVPPSLDDAGGGTLPNLGDAALVAGGKDA